MTDEIYVGGHSLGAARAYEYAYTRVVRGLRVDGIFALAPPNPGCAAIGIALASVPLIRSLKNGRDIVPDVPVDIQWLGEEYVQPRPFEEINEPPPANDLDFLARWHHAPLYVAGAKKLAEPGGAVTLADAADQIGRLYQDTSEWDWINPSVSAYWAMKVMPSGAKLLIARGTVNVHDWLADLDAAMVQVMGARVSVGFYSGIGSVIDTLDAQLA